MHPVLEKRHRFNDVPLHKIAYTVIYELIESYIKEQTTGLDPSIN